MFRARRVGLNCVRRALELAMRRMDEGASANEAAIAVDLALKGHPQQKEVMKRVKIFMLMSGRDPTNTPNARK